MHAKDTHQKAGNLPIRSWPVAAWIGVGTAALVLVVVVWMRLSVTSEPPVQPIRPAQRSARVEDRLKQLRAEWAARSEPNQPGGEIQERKAPLAQLPVTPALPDEVATAKGAESATDNPPAAADDALSQDEPDFNSLKQVATTDPDAQNRLTAVMLLGTMEDPAVVPVLAQVLTDADADVRLMAVQALGDFTSPESAQAVQIAMNDTDPEIRFEALSVLADIGGEGSRAVIQRAVNDDDEDVRALAQGLLSMDQTSTGAAAPANK